MAASTILHPITEAAPFGQVSTIRTNTPDAHKNVVSTDELRAAGRGAAICRVGDVIIRGVSVSQKKSTPAVDHKIQNSQYVVYMGRRQVYTYVQPTHH